MPRDGQSDAGCLGRPVQGLIGEWMVRERTGPRGEAVVQADEVLDLAPAAIGSGHHGPLVRGAVTQTPVVGQVHESRLRPGTTKAAGFLQLALFPLPGQDVSQ